MENNTSYNPPPAWAASTPVERAAHLYACYLRDAVPDMCAAEGITPEQIAEGRKLADAKRNGRRLDRIAGGDPAFGGGRW